MVAHVGRQPQGRSERLRHRPLHCGLVRAQSCSSFAVPHRSDRAFVGYSNANYALSEIRDPVRTIKLAAPLAVLSVAIAYMLANVAYFAVVPKDEILGSGRIVAALFFGKLWGIGAERVSLSTAPEYGAA